jgi:hypothetical protein
MLHVASCGTNLWRARLPEKTGQRTELRKAARLNSSNEEIAEEVAKGNKQITG